MNVLGVKVDNLERREILKKISDFLSENSSSTTEAQVRGKFHQIATVNPEFILEAQKDREFNNVLNSCDLNIADGIGIKFAFWWLGKKLKFRLAGIDLMREILKIADEKKLKIYLVANDEGLSSWEESRDAILRRYPNLYISGSNLDKTETKYQMQDTSYDILFCNFGAPYQEKFINNLKYANIKTAVGVGGSFDYLTGKLKRAPKWMQSFGFEWFWRLIQQPKRAKRIWNAIFVFPIKLIFNSNNEQN